MSTLLADRGQPSRIGALEEKPSSAKAVPKRLRSLDDEPPREVRRVSGHAGAVHVTRPRNRDQAA